jgi:hypothetical protein
MIDFPPQSGPTPVLTGLPDRDGGRRLKEKIMKRAVLVALLIASAPAVAQTATPDSENGRFSFNQVSDGLLRLDARTGQVSLCSKRGAGWACQAVPDERTALENEIARLQDENAKLKKEMIARNLPLPGVSPGPQASKPQPQIELKLPTDADIDRLMTFMEKIWRRLIDMVQSVQKDIEKKG